MNLNFRICLTLTLGATLLALDDSNQVQAQERLAFESEDHTVAQVSLEEVVSLDESEVQAPRVIFRPGRPAIIDRKDESYELHFETIQDGSGKKRILLSVPTSVAEIEITQRTKPAVNETKSTVELNQTSQASGGEFESSSELRLLKNPETSSHKKVSGGLKMVPAEVAVKGRIKNPYFLGVEPGTIQRTIDYASTGHERIKEPHAENRIDSEAYYKKMAEKPSPAIQVRFTDISDK